MGAGDPPPLHQPLLGGGASGDGDASAPPLPPMPQHQHEQQPAIGPYPPYQQQQQQQQQEQHNHPHHQQQQQPSYAPPSVIAYAPATAPPPSRTPAPYAMAPPPPIAVVHHHPGGGTTTHVCAHGPLIQRVTLAPMAQVCPACGSAGPTRVRRERGCCTWLQCFAMCWLFCPLFWLPCCLDCSKDLVHRCGNCGAEVARVTPC